MHPKALLDAATELVRQVLRLDHPADAVVSRYFREHRSLGPRERATLAETAYAVLAELDLEGTLQIAPFHPRFQFAGTDEDDITNATNRAPYPTLHLIREASIDRAVAAFPEAEAIYEANMATLEKLGDEGWAALGVGASAPQGSAR